MKDASFAKITRPKLSGASSRDRLFRLLDKSRQKPVVWVVAQAGSGKTTLAASYLDSRKLPCLWYQVDQGDGDIASFFYYLGMAAKQAAPRRKKPLPLLTPEYLMGLPVFTRRYFEEFYRRLKPPFVIVLDNYQDVPSDAGFHDMLVNGLDVIPEGVTVIVLSRSDPPQQFARLQANSRLQQIGWGDIRFTREESATLMKSQGRGKATKEAADLLHKKTDGWAAGLMLLMAGDTVFDAPASEQVSSASLFDYFASEIFSRTDAQTQGVLLKTSFLQRITAADAEHLTGNESAERILEHLSRHQYFTQKYDRVYQYHPLFREFLQHQAKKSYSGTLIAQIQGTAAGLLEKSGRREEAIGLYLDAGAWPLAERVILSQAFQLVSQGRSSTLEGWFKRLPKEQLESSPWCLYWLGACRVLLSPPEGQAYFEKALLLFQERNDRVGMLRSWAGAVNAVVIGLNTYAPLDRLIAWYNEQDRGTDFPSPELEAEVTANMTGALFGRQPDHPDFRLWAERSLAAARKTSVVELRLFAANYALLYYLWVGDIAGVWLAIDEVRDVSSATNVSPLMKIAWQWLEANAHYWTKGDVEAGLQAFSYARETANSHGISSWDYMICVVGVTGYLLKGDREAAGRLLSEMKSMLMPERSQGYAHYHYLVAWCKILSNDAAGAMSHAELAVKLSAEIAGTALFYPDTPTRLGLANILCENNDYAGAEAQLDVVREQNHRTGSAALEFVHLLTRARLDFARGSEREGVEYLRKAMQLGRSRNYVIPMWWWQPAMFGALCRKALDEGIEVEYVRGLVKKHGLDPDPDQSSEHWPWRLRINTLGRFEVLLNDEPLNFGSKVQKKPLELLKALICMGGKASEQRISEALWPDADGDSGHRSFESALYRLRKLIGDKALRLSDGVLELDRRSCWVDVWEFQHLVRHERSASGGHDIGENARFFERTNRLYRGAFFPHDMHQTWSLSLRERMRSEYIGVVTTCGRIWEEAGEWERAAACFSRGLEAEELAEEFYRHLMLCHVKLGQLVQAESVYRRCSLVLKHALGLAPSPRTEELFRTLRENQ